MKLSLTGRRWELPPEGAAERFAGEPGVSPPVGRILGQRNLRDRQTVEKFLNPRLNQLSSPLVIPNITQAADRVLKARAVGEKILIYGDYDVDGVTGTALLLLALKKLGIPASYYLPHRYREGYGLNSEAINRARDEGVNLIVTVDCGISNRAEIELAQSLGMEVVVTDHHNPPPDLPSTPYLVNPKLISEEHSLKDLSGAGVAFEFAWVLFRRAGIEGDEALRELLDIVAFGTIGDVVPLTGENRILAATGLRVINTNPRPGIRALIEAASISDDITAERMGYVLAPRINAAGRLEDARAGVELFITEDPLRARQLALELSQLNLKRQEIGKAVESEAREALKSLSLEDEKLLVFSQAGWHPGVIGIVAGNLLEDFYRPTILIGLHDGIGRGSARSVEGIDIYEFLKNCGDLFISFGGHRKAAGFKVASDKVELLKVRLREQAAAHFAWEDLTPALKADTYLEAEEISLKLVSEFNRLEPFGEGNPVPTLVTRDLAIREARRVGNGSHLKLSLVKNNKVFDAIGFGMGELADKLVANHVYDLAYNLEANEWNGNLSPQLKLLDIREPR